MAGEGLQRHFAALRELDGQTVSVGWFPEHRYKDGRSVAYVAAKNEFGGVLSVGDGKFVTIPARPLLRTSAIAADASINRRMPAISKSILKGAVSPTQAMQMVGELVIESISDTLKNNDFEPNAPYTVAKKGFNKPLVETGLLGQTVQAKVNVK